MYKGYKKYDHVDKAARGISFTIDANGIWYAHAAEIGAPGPILKERLAKLFGGAGQGIWKGRGLSVDEAGRYWLKTPHTAYEVEVEDLPFLVTSYKAEGAVYIFTTNLGEDVVLSKTTPIALSFSKIHGQELPEIEVRQSLRARFSRQVMYQLAEEGHIEGDLFGITSDSVFYPLSNESVL